MTQAPPLTPQEVPIVGWEREVLTALNTARSQGRLLRVLSAPERLADGRVSVLVRILAPPPEPTPAAPQPAPSWWNTRRKVAAAIIVAGVLMLGALGWITYRWASDNRGMAVAVAVVVGFVGWKAITGKRK